MNVAEMIGITMAVVQFIKAKVWKNLEGTLAVIVTIVVAAGVVVYNTLNQSLPWSLAIALTFIEVIVGALGGYGLLKVAGGTATPAK